MNKLIVLIISLSLFGNILFAEQNISEADKQQIVSKLNSFVELVNKGDVDQIVLLVSPDNSILQTDIQSQIRGGIGYQFDYGPLDKNIELVNEKTIKVNGRFAASGVSWNISGLSNYFVFEKSLNGEWLITDTNFTKKIGFDYMRKILVIVFSVFLIFFIFWLWMLVDCIKRDFNDKALWVLLMIFLNIIATILYYFLIKKRNITKKPLEFKM